MDNNDTVDAEPNYEGQRAGIDLSQNVEQEDIREDSDRPPEINFSLGAFLVGIFVMFVTVYGLWIQNFQFAGWTSFLLVVLAIGHYAIK